ncbi:MAG: DUF6591 domain-containing protein [Oscillospiraceae bacterium]
MKRIIAALAASAMILLTSAGCSGGEKLEWPDNGLFTALPVPEAENGKTTVYSDRVSADLENMTEQQFNSYVSACKEKGFTIDPDERSGSYEAFNADGMKLRLVYYEYNKNMDIYLDEAREFNDSALPKIGLALMLPEFEYDKLDIVNDSSSQFEVYAAEFTEKQVSEYMDKCLEAGYSADYSKSGRYFDGKNSDGYKIRVEYEGFNTMRAAVYPPDKASDDAASSTVSPDASDEGSDAETGAASSMTEPAETETVVNEPAEETSSPVISVGVRPEVKDALDSYEAFMNEYCDFMEKYTANSTDLTLIMEYADYLAKYTEAMDKLNTIDELNEAETIYYAEVTARVNDRLSKFAQ